MDRDGFGEYLKERDAPSDQIDASIAIVEEFETVLAEGDPGSSPEKATVEDFHRFSRRMIDRGTNTWDNYVALIRFARFLGNDALYIAGLELIDGAEALDTLHAKLGERLGTETRDEIFDGIELPPLGTPNVAKPQMTARVMERLEAAVDRDTCAEILGEGLRHLEDDWYLGAKKKYEEAGGIDAYLERKGADFLAELEKHRDEGTLYFNQRIDDDVIAFVRRHREIMAGVREGRIIFEAKIPHQTIEYLKASTPAEKAYHYCHCPWVKESLRSAELRIPATFCNCSAAFHKKPYEVIFGQPIRAKVVESILAGDPWCKFAIHLPEDVAESDS
ncbi:MAG: hypothetical protein JSW65_02160 [Candidatus Bipolaricaulota bacterium]|nr:MAG: hypothetical protein JSW65_02160 [Candidatus Bipolaricaulota bacterium]